MADRSRGIAARQGLRGQAAAPSFLPNTSLYFASLLVAESLKDSTMQPQNNLPPSLMNDSPTRGMLSITRSPTSSPNSRNGGVIRASPSRVGIEPAPGPGAPCLVCRCPTHTDGKPYVHFAPTPTSTQRHVLLHVFCGKMAALAKPGKPEFELLSKSQIETKYKRNRPGDRLAIYRCCRSACARTKKDDSSDGACVSANSISKNEFYLAQEVETFLAGPRPLPCPPPPSSAIAFPSDKKTPEKVCEVCSKGFIEPQGSGNGGDVMISFPEDIPLPSGGFIISNVVLHIDCGKTKAAAVAPGENKRDSFLFKPRDVRPARYATISSEQIKSLYGSSPALDRATNFVRRGLCIESGAATDNYLAMEVEHYLDRNGGLFIKGIRVDPARVSSCDSDTVDKTPSSQDSKPLQSDGNRKRKAGALSAANDMPDEIFSQAVPEIPSSNKNDGTVTFEKFISSSLNILTDKELRELKSFICKPWLLSDDYDSQSTKKRKVCQPGSAHAMDTAASSTAAANRGSEVTAISKSDTHVEPVSFDEFFSSSVETEADCIAFEKMISSSNDLFTLLDITPVDEYHELDL